MPIRCFESYESSSKVIVKDIVAQVDFWAYDLELVPQCSSRNLESSLGCISTTHFEASPLKIVI
jgi:hypothetical protein